MSPVTKLNFGGHAIDPDRIVAGGKNDVVVEVNEASQRLFATMLMRLTEMAIEVGRVDGAEGMAALHGAMGYLSESDLGPEVRRRAGELRAWAESCGLAAM